jgi:hypothetical protein
MLGWGIYVFRQPMATNSKSLAEWMTSHRGLDWLDRLVAAGKATDLGGNGYPNRYAVKASVLLPILAAGLPENNSPVVVGDDYVLPAGWNGELILHREAVANCPVDADLIVEAWDQS